MYMKTYQFGFISKFSTVRLCSQRHKYESGTVRVTIKKKIKVSI